MWSRERNLSPRLARVWSFGCSQICVLGSLFLDREDVKILCLVDIRSFSEGTKLPWLDIRLWDTKGLSEGLGASGPKGLRHNYYSQSYSCIYKQATWETTYIFKRAKSNKIRYFARKFLAMIKFTESPKSIFRYSKMIREVSVPEKWKTDKLWATIFSCKVRMRSCLTFPNYFPKQSKLRGKSQEVKMTLLYPQRYRMFDCWRN